MVVVTRTGVDDATPDARSSRCSSSTPTRPGSSARRSRSRSRAPEKQYTLFFDDVEVPADRLLGDEGDGLRQVFDGLNPERIMSASICTGIGRYALDARRPRTRNEREVWGVPIGTHQGVAHPLAQRQDRARARPPDDAEGGVDARPRRRPRRRGRGRQHGEVRGRRGRRCTALDAAIQTHGGNGMATEYGLADLWGMVRLLRIAPVSREMILNFVAQQSLGLPKSY